MKKYKIESSPFLSLKGKSRVALQEVKNIEGDFVIVKKKYYQSNEYAKIIIQPELNLSDYISLSSCSKDLIYYIIHILEYNNPTFRMKVDNIAPLINRGVSTVYKAINELIKNNIIAKTDTREVYWINHNKYYKGNYTFETYIKQKST